MNYKKLYHQLMGNSNKKDARQLIRYLYEEDHLPIKAIARELEISRNTVRRAIRGPLEDLSKKPHNVRKTIPEEHKIMIINEAKNTGFGYKKLWKHIKIAYGIEIPQYRVKYVLRRYTGNYKKKRRSKNGNVRHLYEYGKLSPFEELQIDTKKIRDTTALPEEHIKLIDDLNLPVWEWNAIDAATRIRFTAYSHSINATFGLFFITFVVLWLRKYNVKSKIRIRTDNGSEFASGSMKKLIDINNFLGQFGAELYPIAAGKKYQNAIVENLHGKDDSEFLIPRLRFVRDKYDFLKDVKKWVDFWNQKRPHFGIEMYGKTPLEKLRSYNSLINQNVVDFPVFLIEDVLNTSANAFLNLINFKLNNFINSNLKTSMGGQYVWYRCL